MDKGPELTRTAASWRLRLRWLVPALLLLVAGIQVGRVVELDQSTWIGGGFGMFATYDYDDTRVVVAWWDTPDGHVAADLTHVRAEDHLRARVVPTRRTAATVAAQIRDGGAVPGATRLVLEIRGRHLEGDTIAFPVLVRVEFAP